MGQNAFDYSNHPGDTPLEVAYRNPPRTYFESLKMSVQSISCVEFVSAILARKGCQFAGWRVKNSVALSGGKKCPFHGATKTADIGVSMGVNLAKRAGRELEARKWGQRIVGTPIVTHTPKGSTELKVYLSTDITSYNLVSYNDCDGNEISPADIAASLVKREASDLGVYADYSLESIKTVYRIVDGVRTAYTLDHADLSQVCKLF